MRPPTVLLATLVAVLALGLGLDRVLPAPRPAPPTPVAPQAVAGAWYCAVGDTTGDSRLRLMLAVPPGAARSADTRIDLTSGGSVEVGPTVEVFPGSHFTQAVVSGRQELAAVLRWWRAPTAGSRTWTRVEPGVTTGLVEGPCAEAPGTEWIVPGMTTAGGAEAQLVVANPFDGDAAVAVEFATPTGWTAPILLENVAVPARSVRVIDVNEHAPEEPDLGARIRARTGRVVVEGLQTLNAAIGGVDGVSLLRATRVGADTWSAPWVWEDGEAVRSWLWVTNPSDRAATVTVTLHTNEGAVTPEGLEEVTLGPGTVQRIDLRGAVPGPEVGWTVRSADGIPVVASAATVVSDPAVIRTGLAVTLGAPAPDTRWVLAGAVTPVRRERLLLLNVGGEVATVDVVLWTASGRVQPTELEGVEVAPGARRIVDLTPFIPRVEGEYSAYVTARTGSVVAGREARDGEGTLLFVSTLGVPSAAWLGPVRSIDVQYDPGLAHDLRSGASSPAPEATVTP